MFEAGLLKEVENLKNNGLSAINRSMQGIGYKEVLLYIDGKCDYDQMVSLIKQSSRRYAKRQLTWFKRYDFIKWFDYDQIKDKDALEDAISSYIREKLI
jgi:tRNA dimethylallyltransferase